MTDKRMTSISLFCSGGIGDLAARAAGIEVLVANELLHDRCEVFKKNYPCATLIEGDIWEKQEEIVQETKDKLNGKDLDFVIATPPCQGMSSNGMGKLLNGIRSGKKCMWDERNKLIIPTMNIIEKLHPISVCFENVTGMEKTVIQIENGEIINIIDYIKQRLGKEYTGRSEVVEFADFGVPEKRQRLISIFSRNHIAIDFFNSVGSFIPPTTHSAKNAEGKKKYITVNDTISDFPPLDAKNKEMATSAIPFHRVPVLDADKYFWVSNTPTGGGAFDNQCVACGFQGNPVHGTERINGINKHKTDTPIRCIKCGELLPRPWVYKDGEYRIMSGFTSAYKRMNGNQPASALTCNLSYACSDHKLHPTQNRVLSLYEAFHIHTISDFDYKWERADGKKISDATVRDIIGESIPPRGLLIILKFYAGILTGKNTPTARQLLLGI